MATEIAILPLISGRRPDDPSSESGLVWKDVLDTVSQQDGFQRCHWGRSVEDPDILRFFVDWDSVDAHQKFVDAPQYKPFMDQVGRIINMKKASRTHAHYYPHPPSAALSDARGVGVTEILTAYFPESYSDSDRQRAEADIKAFVSALEGGRDIQGFRGSAGGWVVEPSPIPDSEEAGTAYSALFAWDSVAAHMQARETQTFKDNIHYLRKLKDLKKLHVVHASCVEHTPGGGAGEIGDAGRTAAGSELNPAAPRDSVKTAADGTTTKKPSKFV